MKIKGKIISLATLTLCLFSMTLSACASPTNSNGAENGNNSFTYYTVTFNSQGGSEVNDQRVIEGNPVVRPDTPNRDGYNFTGWYKSADGADEWDFNIDRATANLTLYAHWEEQRPSLPETPDDTIEPTEGTESLTYTLENGTYTVTGVGQETAIIIPAVYNGVAVTKIGRNPTTFRGAFANSDIQSIVIPDSVTEIDINAFNNASSLRTVTIGENSLLTTIGNNAFSGNSSLRFIYIPAGVTSIGSGAFNNCGALDAITVASGNTAYYSVNGHLIESASNTLIRGSNNGVVPDGVVSIANAAFRRSTISAITLPASVAVIGNYAFDDCANLATFAVAADNAVYSSFNGILYNKPQTEIVAVPDALSGDIALSEALTEIPRMAFDGISGITELTIPKTVTNIGALAFRGLTIVLNYDGTESEWNAIAKSSSWQTDAALSVRYASQQSNILVVYFSATGNTKTVAGYVAEKTGGTSVEIIPEVPYTDADLNYNNSNSRSQVERRQNARPAISNVTYNAVDITKYDAVFIGYPIWNGYEPMIIRTFAEHYGGLSGKTVYTFSTSGSSGGVTAFNSISGLCPNARMMENRNITSSGLSNAERTIESWINELNLNAADQSVNGRQIKMTFSGHEITAALEDNSAAQDLVSRLRNGSITLSFSDYGGSEKIAYPEPSLDASDTEGCDPVAGDITIYTPWGNIAVFYKDSSGYSNSLVKLGTIDGDGVQFFAAQNGAFPVEISLIS